MPNDIDVQPDIVSNSINGIHESNVAISDSKSKSTVLDETSIVLDIDLIDPFTQLKSEYLYTKNQVRKLFCDAGQILKDRKNKNILVGLLDDRIVLDILCEYIGEQFYFPPEVFQTNFDGNGWVCLKPNLRLGHINTLAVKSPTGIQIDWNWGKKLRYELSFEWDLRHMRFLIISTFYNTKIYNGKDMKMDLDYQSPKFPCVMGVEVNLKHSVPLIQVWANGENLVSFKIPIHRKEFQKYNINEDMFSNCREINFFLGARIRELAALWYDP